MGRGHQARLGTPAWGGHIPSAGERGVFGFPVSRELRPRLLQCPLATPARSGSEHPRWPGGPSRGQPRPAIPVTFAPSLSSLRHPHPILVPPSITLTPSLFPPPSLLPHPYPPPSPSHCPCPPLRRSHNNLSPPPSLSSHPCPPHRSAPASQQNFDSGEFLCLHLCHPPRPRPRANVLHQD